MNRSAVGRVRGLVGIGLVLTIVWLVPMAHGRVVTLVSPVIVAIRRTGESVQSTVKSVRAIPYLTKENKEVNQKILELQSVTIENEELRHENRVLRQELGFSQTETGKTVPALVVSRTSSIVGQTIVINKGQTEGITRGMPIIAQGYLVGTVKSVTPTTSVVTLITSANSIVPVVLQQSRSVGLLRGGAQGLILEEIPRDVTLASDEALVTSPLGEVVKSGIPVGRVSVLLGSKSDVFQSARVISPIDFSRLEIVFGVKS